MKDIRVVFMGTPTFGKEILRCLVEADYQVVGVVCQPDKLVGRKQVLTFPESKVYALEHEIEVFQPLKIRDDYQQILDWQPDLIVTCAYGQIIPDVILNTPKYGCINVHASLLPNLRGGAPIQHSIIDGYAQTGITIMEMVKKMDAGAIISQAALDIDINDTYGSLHDKLIPLAQNLLLETLPSILNKSYVPIKQDEEKVTFGMNISKEEEHLDLTRGYLGVYNQIRGLAPVPYCYGIVDDKKVKFCEVTLSDETSMKENGTIIFYQKELGLVVDGRVMVIKKIQLEGKQMMASKDFRNGAGRNFDGVLCK